MDGNRMDGRHGKHSRGGMTPGDSRISGGSSFDSSSEPFYDDLPGDPGMRSGSEASVPGRPSYDEDPYVSYDHVSDGGSYDDRSYDDRSYDDRSYDDPFSLDTPAPGTFSRGGNRTSGRPMPSNNYFSHNGDRGARKADRVQKHRRRGPLYIALACILCAVLVFGIVKLIGALTGGSGTIAPGQEVTISIPEGSGTSAISELLAKNGVVDSASSFTSYVKEQDAESSLKPGSYLFITGSDYDTVLKLLESGPNAAVTLTIPEGYTIEQTAAAVQDACGIPSDEFLALCHSADTYATEYPFLSGAYGNSLEGYLFPKTYSVPQGATADDVVRMMLSQFQTETAGLDLTYAQSQGLDLSDVVTMASLVEEECLYDQDRAHIAGVLYNRLSQGMRLQLDVTVAYALGGNDGNLVNEDDLTVDSPYNTYVVDGLPAGPISSPSLASLQAVCAPESTQDIYFILTKDYSHFYANYDDFLAGKAEYEASL